MSTYRANGCTSDIFLCKEALLSLTHSNFTVYNSPIYIVDSLPLKVEFTLYTVAKALIILHSNHFHILTIYAEWIIQVYIKIP
jgi:hypothetical protein